MTPKIPTTYIHGAARYTCTQAAILTGYTRARINQYYHGGEVPGVMVCGRLFVDAAAVKRIEKLGRKWRERKGKGK